MIGKICISLAPYYDAKDKKYKFKERPVLIVGQADSSDYNALPISRVTNSKNLDSDYDVMVDPEDYPNLNFKELSYIRVHKQTVFHESSLHPKSDLKSEYPQLFQEIMEKLKKYNEDLYELAI